MTTLLPVTLKPTVCHLLSLNAEVLKSTFLSLNINVNLRLEIFTEIYILFDCLTVNMHSFFENIFSWLSTKNTENSSGRYWQFLKIRFAGNMISFVSFIN